MSAGRTVVVVIDATPDKCLAPNAARRTYWRVKSDVSREMRAMARYKAVEARYEAFGYVGPEPDFRGAVELTERVWWGKGERRVDTDAIPSLCKPYLDGIVDAGLLAGDGQVQRLTVEQGKAKDGRGYTELEITEIAAGEERRRG